MPLTTSVAEPYRVIRDPVYGYVHVPDRLIPIVDSPIFQRLRRVSQTSLTLAVYPSATGTRFEHALGTMYLAGRAFTAAWESASQRARDVFLRTLRAEVPELGRLDDETTRPEHEVKLAVMGVGLLHDLGHPPFSHILEPVYERHAGLILDGPDREEILHRLEGRNGQLHEAAGEYLLEKYIIPIIPDRIFGSLLKSIYVAEPVPGTACGVLHSIVSGELDVDRLDYLMRDGQRAGTEYGAIDWERLVDAFKLQLDEGKPRFLPTLRARSAAESLLVQRVQAYRWMIYHPRVVGTNLALASAMDRLLTLIQQQDVVELSGGLITLSDLFRKCVANLNYLDPGPSAVEPLAIAVQDTQATTAGVMYTAIRADVNKTQAVCATVDDSSVIRSLAEARIAADVIASEAPGEIATLARELRCFIDAALLRRKNFVAVWKSEAEFVLSAAKMWNDRLGDAVDRAFERATANGRPIFDRTKFDTLTPAEKVNRIMLDVTARHRLRSSLEDALRAQLSQTRSFPGVWRVVRTDLVAVARGTKAGALWDDERRRFVLRDKSELVKALQRVDGQRPKVAIYYFFTDSGMDGELRPDRLETSRAVLLGQVMEVLPAFLEARLDDTTFARPDEGSAHGP